MVRKAASAMNDDGRSAMVGVLSKRKGFVICEGPSISNYKWGWVRPYLTLAPPLSQPLFSCCVARDDEGGRQMPRRSSYDHQNCWPTTKGLMGTTS